MKTPAYPHSVAFKNGPGQELHLSQRQSISTQLQQALYLLQLPVQELEAFIEGQIALNPILEIDRPEEGEEMHEEEPLPGEKDLEEEVSISDTELTLLSRLDEEWDEHFAQTEPMPIHTSSREEEFKTYLEQSIIAHENLYDYLLREAHQTFESTTDLEAAEILIGYVDARGFLTTPIREICEFHQVPEPTLCRVLGTLQTLEPYGIAASSIQESLLIQLRCLNKTDTLGYRIVRDHYDEFLHNRIPLLQKRLKCSYESIQKAIEEDIAKLDLHPGSRFASVPARVIVPDATLHQEAGKWIVRVEREDIPPLRLNRRYLAMLHDPSVNQETKHFLKRHFFSARWLARSLQRRYSSIERIAEALAEKQSEFFTRLDGKLVPLTLKVLADELNLHESTIARTLSNKYIDTPRGLLPFSLFFTGRFPSEKGEDLSSATVKEAIEELIAKEDKRRPLSDQTLSLLLKQKGISCARRTVNKYRALLKIADARQRKRFKS